MKLIFLFASFVLLFSSHANLELEKLENTYRQNPNIFHSEIEEGLSMEIKRQAFVNALWDNYFEDQKKEEVLTQLEKSNLSDFNRDQLLHLRVLISYSGLDMGEINKVLDEDKRDWSREEYLRFISLKENYPKAFTDLDFKGLLFQETLEEFKNSQIKDEWNEDQKRELLTFDPKWRRSFRSYKNGVKLYMFCRHNREHPCLMVMKDKNGAWVKNQDGSLWAQPKLALSRHGLPSHQRNGHTPQGVYTIDSVMPEANRQLVFGKHRRLILNFIPSSRSEKDLLSFMPDSAKSLNWWRSNIVARDVGRSLLRIHGTGLINTDPASSWYPFYPTSGCIASRENRYDGITFKDQQELLDQMMRSMGLNPTYGNEPNLKGLLYVVSIDSKEEAVSLADLPL